MSVDEDCEREDTKSLTIGHGRETRTNTFIVGSYQGVETCQRGYSDMVLNEANGRDRERRIETSSGIGDCMIQVTLV